MICPSSSTALTWTFLRLDKSLIDRASEILDIYENKNNKKQPFVQTSLFLNLDEKEEPKESYVEEKIKHNINLLFLFS